MVRIVTTGFFNRFIRQYCTTTVLNMQKPEAAAGIGFHLFATIKEIYKAGREMKQMTCNKYES